MGVELTSWDNDLRPKTESNRNNMKEKLVKN